MGRTLSIALKCTTAAVLTFAGLRLRKRFQQKARQEQAAKTIQRAWRHNRAHALWKKQRLDAAQLIQRRWREVQTRARESEQEDTWEATLIGAAHTRVIDPERIWIHQLLGEGSHGKVWIAEEENTGDLVAIKELSKKGEKAQECARTEVDLMQAAGDHDFCLSILATFQDQNNAYLVTDFIGGGDLRSILGSYVPLPEECAQFYCANILMALEHVHSKNIIHSDVKLENLLMGADGYLVLGDFGLSKFIPSGCTYSKWGTPPYMAPEYFREDVGLTPAADYWALGVILYIMVTGKLPFGRSLRRQREADFEMPHNLSHEGCHFLTQLLAVNPEERLTHEALDHCWFDNVDLGGIWNKTEQPPIIPDVIELKGDGKKFGQEATQGRATGHPTTSEDQDWDEGVWRQLHAAC